MNVTVDNIRKMYGDVEALRGISFDLESGELYCVLGPSGSGKTTLLRIIAMLEKCDSGMVLYDGCPPDDLIRDRIVMVLQKPVVFKDTVFENVAYGLKIRRTPREEIDDRVSSALELVGMHGFEERWAPSLSAGEQQRVAFARAIVLDPSLLLLDEFTANLDPAHVKVLENSVLAYLKKEDSTILFATHDLNQVKRMRPRIIFIKEGRVVEISDPEEFLTSAKTEEGRRFVEGEL